MPPLRIVLALCLPALGVAGCAEQQQAQVAAFGYAADNVGKAAVCTAPAVSVQDGKEAAGTIATGGGGWCGIPVTRDGRPLSAGLLTQAPRSGSVYVHLVGRETRVDYMPRGAVAGADSFAVKFIPGDETMHVTVSAAAAGAAK